MSNNVGAGKSFRRSIDLVFLAYDTLPAPLRRALAEGIVEYDPVRVHELRKQNADREIIDAIRRSDDLQIKAFARACWPACFGRYPHIAADATILRYDEAGRVRAKLA